MIYFDNSATTCVDAEVADRAVEIMCHQFGNPSSLHGVGSSAYAELGIARNQIAKMIAARTSDIYFTSGGTESNNIAVQGAARACRWGKHIVTTAIEHDSILKACAYLESGGWQVTYVAPNPDTHHIAAQDIIDAVRDDTVLVSVMFVNNETGEILPIKEIVNGVRKRNPKTLIHCDCVQGFGKLPFKLHVYDVDMISASAHKIHGPKGIGALYLRRPDLVFPLEFGGSQEGKVNPGTESVPLACAFGLASDRALYSMTSNAEKVSDIRKYLLQLLLTEFPAVHINSPKDGSPFILNVSFPGIVSHELVSFLSLHQIYLSTGSACTKGAPSHVLNAMNYSPSVIRGALRISFNKHNTKEEVDMFIQTLKQFPGFCV